jgi:KipI family sensor histidine kinase inhibitor
MNERWPRVVPFGERAYLVEVGDRVDEATNARVHALAARLDGGRHAIVGLGRCVPAYASLLVPVDPARSDVDALPDQLRALVAETAPVTQSAPSRTVELSVRYGGDHGPDLEHVAARLGLDADAVIELHSAVTYRVFMLGFAPGFAYLGPLPEALRLPRRPEPRVRVPPGSVAIAGAQTAVYPHGTPGGWHLLGRTDARLWDRDAREPAALHPGDHVRFVPA